MHHAGLTLVASAVLARASVDPLCAAPFAFSGWEASMETKPGASPLRRAQRGYQLLRFFSGTVMAVAVPSVGFFTSSSPALALGRLTLSPLPEVVRRVVQAVDAFPAEVSPWMASSQDAPAPAARGKESSAHTRALHVLMASATSM